MMIRRLFPLLLFTALLLSACPTTSDDPGPSRPDAGPDEKDADSDRQDSDTTEPDADDEAPVELKLLSISPTSGPTTGGTVVTLSGRGFMEGMSVYFGGERAPTVTRQGALSAQATTPPAPEPATVDIIVENPDHTRVTLASAFTFESPPRRPGR